MALFVEELGYGQGCSFMDCCREFFCNLAISSPTGGLTLSSPMMLRASAMTDHGGSRKHPSFARFCAFNGVFCMVPNTALIASHIKGPIRLCPWDDGNVAGTFVDGVLIRIIAENLECVRLSFVIFSFLCPF